MIHYYTELLGMKDTIEEEDLYVDVTKTDLEMELQEKSRTLESLKERFDQNEKNMQEVMATLHALRLEHELKERTEN